MESHDQKLQGSPLVTRTPKKKVPNSPARNVLGTVWNDIKKQVELLAPEVRALLGPFCDQRTRRGIGTGATCTVDLSNNGVIRKVSLSRCMQGRDERFFYRILPLCQESTAIQASAVASDVLAEINFLTSVRGYPNFVQLARWNFANMGDDLRFYFAIPFYSTVLGRSETALSELACGITHALAYMHEELKVTHRDVKPDNILKRDEPRSNAGATGRYVLSDFGCVAPLGSAAGHQRGTPSFYPPRGEPLFTPEADVYALGLTICACLFGSQVLQNEMFMMQSLKASSTACQEFVIACLSPAEKRPSAHQLCKMKFVQIWKLFVGAEDTSEIGPSTDEDDETKMVSFVPSPQRPSRAAIHASLTLEKTEVASFVPSPQRPRGSSSGISASPANEEKTEWMSFARSPPYTGSSRLQRLHGNLSSPPGNLAVSLFASPPSGQERRVPNVASLLGFSLPSGLKRKASVLEEDDRQAQL